MSLRSVHIVALGSECPGGVGPGDETAGPGQFQGGLLWSYLGHGARELDPNSVTPSRLPLNPAFMEYQSRVFGDVRVMVRDCPSWDLLDSDWASVRSVVEQADIVVIKYSVNDKLAFQQVRNVYAPRLRPLLRHWGVPVILVAVGARLNDEGPPCTCPLCASDWSSCVPHSEGLQLSRDLGATYLELPSLNNFFVGRYFGSVLEYFMIQCLKQKAKERPDKRRGHRFNEPRPPHLDQPARLPPVRVEESTFSQDLQWLLERGVQFADVAFYAGDSGKELGWAHASVLCAISPYFRQLLVGRQAWERPVSRCTCRDRDGPHSLLSTWDGGIDDLPRADGHPPGHLSRLVVKDPLLCLCLWETLMFLYRGAWEWEYLEEAIAEKLKNPLAVAQLMDRIRSFVGREKCCVSVCSASVLQAMAVLVCAEMYQVKRLQHLCEVCVCAYLQSMPSRELASMGISVIRLLKKAKCHNADQLYVWLLHFIANNYLIFSHKPDFLELSDEEREQVERLRWPSRGYLQELSEYQQRRRQIRKSRCSIM
ncbi:rho-related BTB domain-containing protein 3-like [Sinocyclocheilus rhinocerous]|uniref:rho-related BTB domain-containing protein 3-like n=1 Tax=Sinocyclocheilus rhinocerous TaxID=307959 RepID=UPI0007BA3668|nr:PREDICTED: rho-related BTB domain-containing protein 3-like [Sinocyclocheilus rhinocerous]